MIEKDYTQIYWLGSVLILLISQTQLYTVKVGITGVGIILQVAFQSDNHTIPSRSPVCGKNGTELQCRSIFPFLISSSWKTALGFLAPNSQMRTLSPIPAPGRFLRLGYIWFRISQPGNPCKAIHKRQPMIVPCMFIKKGVNESKQSPISFPLGSGKDRIRM